MKKFTYMAVLSALVIFLTCCKKNKENSTTTGKYTTGYNIGTEDQDTIPKSINTKGFASSSSSVPSSYFLYKYLPPVGDQGQYGTCIAWSSGYYMKTSLEAIAGNYSSNQLASPSNQMSPKDLFTAIPDASKGASTCDGTNFAAALSVMQSRGVATLQTVPYTGLSTCSQSALDPSWATDAANHKISTYRALTDNSISDYVADIKQNIASNTPVMIGIGVGAGFQNWTGSGVMTSGFDPCGGGGNCGGHAQCIVGYDDSKGAGGAFRVVNSWNTTWGDAGFYWVDYNFMFNTLAQKDNNGNYCVFVATNGTSTVTPPSPNTNPASGVDLAAWVQVDSSTGTPFSPTRTAIFDIYNIGTATAPASANWGLYYIYYNAFDANDYGVIFYDAFDNGITVNTASCNSTGDSCEVNYDIPAGSDLASLFSSSLLYQNYTMPNITGDYYLILVADAGQVLGDVNYNNNIFYTSDYYAPFQNGYFGKNGEPGLVPNFSNGTRPTRELLKGNSFNTAVNAHHLNAYTPKEVLGFLKKKKATGELDAKVRAFQNSNSNYKGGISGK